MCRLPKANQRENKREIIKMKTIVFRWLSEDDKWVRKSLMITMAPAVDVWKDQRRIFSRIIFQLTISRLPAVTSITIIIRFLTFSTSCRLTCSSILLWWRLTHSLSLVLSIIFISLLYSKLTNEKREWPRMNAKNANCTHRFEQTMSSRVKDAQTIIHSFLMFTRSPSDRYMELTSFDHCIPPHTRHSLQ